MSIFEQLDLAGWESQPRNDRGEFSELRGHVRQYHARMVKQGLPRSNEDLSTAHAKEHHRYGSHSHRHEGVNLGAGQRPPGWYTGKDVIQLSISGQAIELDWHDAWMHEARGPHGEWVHGAGTISRQYAVADHARLINPRSPYPEPGDHPFFRKYPPKAENILAAYDAATPEEHAQGMRWYQDAHNIATAIAGGNSELGGGLLATYSPQAAWPVNMFNAARAAREHRSLSTHEGMTITGNTMKLAQAFLDGKSIDEVLNGEKTNAFAHLISRGEDDPSDPYGKVVIDRHALSVAVGQRLPEDAADPIGNKDPRYYQFVADEYRKAAIARGITPHQMQAVTWLHQQNANQAEDARMGALGSLDTRLQRGRVTSTQGAWERWAGYTGQQPEIPLHIGTTFEQVVPPITADEARGNSRPVSAIEFQRLAAAGRSQMRQLRKNKRALTGLDRNWATVKDHGWAEVQKSWGGATFDAHTGDPLPQGADKYAITVKPAGMPSVSVPENASQADFAAAMDRALAQFRPQLESAQSYLGVFHDDESHRIDIDPVTVVDTQGEVDAIGAYTHAIGGAYHFKSGDGYWPPHVGATEMANDQAGHHWAGPGQWRSYAAEVQPGLSPFQQAEIETDEPDSVDGQTPLREQDFSSIFGQLHDD